MKNCFRALGLVLPALLGLPITSCSGDSETCTGAERCACYPNGTCDGALACLSNTCVDMNGSAGANSAGGLGAEGGDHQASSAGTTSLPSGGNGAGGVGSGDSGGAGGSEASGGDGAVIGAGGGGAAGGEMTDGGAGSGGAGQTCRTFETYPEGTVPTVFVLVDRSGSMFHCLSASGPSACLDQQDTPWAALKVATLDMVQKLEGSVRFAFGSFSGEQAGTCPDFTKVGAALNNYQNIAAAYEAITPPTKGETPTAQVVRSVQTIMAGDASPGRKYVLLVTDGEPDFCDDGDPVCPLDATVGALQALSASGVTTLVFGVDSKLSTISGSTMQAFADAGAGTSVAQPATGATVQLECQGITGWSNAYAASGSSGSSIGAYSAASGGASVFRPDPSDQAALTNLFQTAVSGLKSCFFDLSAGLSVNLTKLAKASVKIEGALVPRSDSNGWRMKTATQLELRGSACELWHQPDSRNIAFDFPCGTVVEQ